MELEAAEEEGVVLREGEAEGAQAARSVGEAERHREHLAERRLRGQAPLEAEVDGPHVDRRQRPCDGAHGAVRLGVTWSGWR